MHNLRTLFTLALVSIVAMIPMTASGQEAIPSEFEQPATIVAMSFIGGHIDELRTTLRQRGIIDENDKWIAGDTQYVQMGEVAFHGLHVIECLELLYDLQQQAQEAGGKVHMLLGHFESLILRGDIVRVPKPNFEHLADPNDSDDIRAEMKAALEKRRAQLVEFNAHLPEAEREQNADRYVYYFETIFEHPGAWVFIQKFARGTKLGDWLRSCNSSIQIGPYIFTAGGIHPDFMDIPLAEINRKVREEVNKDLVYVPIMSVKSKLPNWWQEPTGYEDSEVFIYMRSLIEKKNIRALIINHSRTDGRCLDRWNLYQVMSGFTHDGKVRVLPSCLEITQGSNDKEDRFVYYQNGNQVMTRSPYPVTRFSQN